MKTITAAHTRPAWGAYAILLLAALLLWPTQRFIDSRNAQNNEDPDLLLFSSPKLLKKMALGYDGMLADFYWMRTIQYFGRFDAANRRKVRYKNLYKLLDITTTLDPKLLDAYRFGAFFLANDQPIGAGDPHSALKLMDKGIHDNPEVWQLPYDKGFIYYWYLKDFKSAGETWLQAGKVPGAPEWMSGLAAVALSRGGALEIALAIWQERYLGAARKEEREDAENRLCSFIVAQDIWGWQAEAEKYREKTGAYPATLKQLSDAQKPGPRYSLTDPLGTPYRYDPHTGAVFLDADTRVHYLEVPEIYRDELIKAPPLTNLLFAGPDISSGS